MRSFKSFLGEKKLPHALDPNKSLKHAFKDRGFDKDNDGDVDKFDKTTPDEITGDENPNQTPKMMKKYAGELKHTKKGMAYEQTDEPASPDEKGMALDQAKFLKYVADEIVDYLNKDKEFPEWMQNKLSGLHEKAKDMHAVMAGKYDDKNESLEEAYVKSMGYKGVDDMIRRMTAIMTPNSVLCKSISREADNVVPEFKKMEKAMKQINAAWDEVEYTIGMNESLEEGSESWEAGYKRRVVKTNKPEHKEKGYKWRIKGKDRPEISIKLYKEKPSQQEFNKQMKRVAGHEFGG